MVGNKNSGRRPHDGLPRSGGRPRTRLIIQMPTIVIDQLHAIADAEHATTLDVVREAILSYISDWQDRHDS